MFVPDSEFPSCRNVNLSEAIQVKGALRFYVRDFLELIDIVTKVDTRNQSGPDCI